MVSIELRNCGIYIRRPQTSCDEVKFISFISFTVGLVDFGLKHVVNKMQQWPMTLAIVLSLGLVEGII